MAEAEDYAQRGSTGKVWVPCGMGMDFVLAEGQVSHASTHGLCSNRTETPIVKYNVREFDIFLGR